MAEQIDGRVKEILEAPNFCVIGSIEQDGAPFLNPVWCHPEGDLVVINTAEGRHWPANVRRDKRVRLLIADQSNPYEYVSITATLAEETHEGADENIDALAKKYMDLDSYPFRQEGEQRVIFRFAADRIYHNAAG